MRLVVLHLLAIADVGAGAQLLQVPALGQQLVELNRACLPPSV
jgi:hypothetical protein